MKCHHCQETNGDHRFYCRKCGVRLLFQCSQCGFANETRDLYCGGCGRKQSETAAPPSKPTAGRETQAPRSPSVPPSFLTQLLTETPKEKTDSKETKKTVTQDEIEKLFDQ